MSLPLRGEIQEAQLQKKTRRLSGKIRRVWLSILEPSITHGSHGTRTVIPSGSPREDHEAKNCTWCPAARASSTKSLFQKGGLERRKGMNPKPYPSDLTSQQWAVLKPFLPPARTGGRPRKTEMRSVVNAIFYRNRNGCIWRALPHDFPP